VYSKGEFSHFVHHAKLPINYWIHHFIIFFIITIQVTVQHFQ